MNDDLQLLRSFAREGDEAAFRRLVELRIDFVFATSLRHVCGDVHLAQDIAQSVFIDLARKASAVSRYESLTGWLYTSTRFASAKALRARMRRASYESRVVALDEQENPAMPSEAGLWREVRPILDAALAELPERDRNALLMRYFDGKSLAEVGACVGLSENAARMRVDRALEKLRARLERYGATSTAVALAEMLASHPAIGAPAGLASQVAGASLASLAWAGAPAALASAFSNFMTTGKSILIATTMLGAATLGLLWGRQHPSADALAKALAKTGTDSSVAFLQQSNRRLQAENAQLRASQALSQSAAIDSLGSKSLGTLERLRLLVDLAKNKILDPRLTLVDKGKITDAFANLFGLTPQERGSLQHALDDARGKLGNLESQHATVSRDAQGNVVVQVSPFPETGGAVYDTLMTSLADTLGPERYSAYLTLGDEQMEKTFAQFGAAQRIVTFAFNPSSTGSPYALNDEQNVRTAGNSWETTSSTTYSSYAQMAAAAGTISGLLPADFHRSP